MQNEQNTNSTTPSKEEGKPETITELAHRHLKDENHTTSDEELRNATVEFSEETGDPEESQDNLFELDHTTLTGDTENNETVVDSDDDKDKHNNPPNPYTILNP